MDFNLFLKIFLIVLIEKWSKVSWSNKRNMLDIHLVLHQKKKTIQKTAGATRLCNWNKQCTSM